MQRRVTMIDYDKYLYSTGKHYIWRTDRRDCDVK